MCEGTHLRCVGGEERPSSGRAIILHHDRPTATLGLHLLLVLVVVVVMLELPYSTHHTGLADRSSTPVHHSMPSMRHRLGQASRRQRLLLGRHQGCVDKTRLDCLQHLQVCCVKMGLTLCCACSGSVHDSVYLVVQQLLAVHQMTAAAAPAARVWQRHS